MNAWKNYRWKLMLGIGFVLTLILINLNGCKMPHDTVYNTTYIVQSDSLSNPEVQPRVIFTNPANGATGPFDSYNPNTYPSSPPITIQFNKLINVLNIRNNEITLKTGDQFLPLELVNISSSTGEPDPLFRDVLFYRVSGSKYLAGKIYTLTIDTTLTDMHGNHLKDPYVVSFTPEPNFRVYSTTSSTSDVDPDYSNTLFVYFNSLVNASIFDKITIDPPVRGRWKLYGSGDWVDSTAVQFSMKDTLQFDTQYTLTVAAGAMDYMGLVLQDPYLRTFRTTPFQVRLNSYSSGTDPAGFNYYNYFQFVFNGVLDTATVRSSLEISPVIPMNVSFPEYSGSSYKIVSIVLEQEQPDTQYRITFHKTIRSIKGIYLKNPFTYSFTTGSID